MRANREVFDLRGQLAVELEASLIDSGIVERLEGYITARNIGFAEQVEKIAMLDEVMSDLIQQRARALAQADIERYRRLVKEESWRLVSQIYRHTIAEQGRQIDEYREPPPAVRFRNRGR